MAQIKYKYDKGTCNPGQLLKEITDEGLPEPLSLGFHPDPPTDNVHLSFDPALSGPDKTTLDSLVTNHSAIFPLGERIIAQGTTNINDDETVTLVTITRNPSEVLQICSFLDTDIVGAWGEQSEEANPLNKLILYFEKTVNPNECNAKARNGLGQTITIDWKIIGIS